MLLAAIVLQASAVSFAPPLDMPLRVVSERRDGTRAFRLERELRFAREGTGYRAEVILRTATGETPDGSGALYEAGYAALIGTPILFHLDAAGALAAIDDMPALWERYCTRVAEVAAGRRVLAPADRAKLAARIAAPLRALPAEKQRAMLASLVSAVIVEEPLAPGSAPVHLPASSAYGSAAPLDGMRIVVPIAGGLLRSSTSASSDTVTLEQVSELDPRTGLIARSSKTVRIRAGGLEKLSTTLVILEPLPH
ncbi:hypothetical protein P6144_11460 [Sphingomonas sp. HITSZ_GF]|uniref:hypothetical protein n=1 Tax=Sphingomonas sp. HITSZ_GF TaxID=3037247 RepID=UPI00240E2D55|nr:hypothetical protein [Sphingomonas sp. HITSZ_GF]MDG2534269.1 hypothetical protein [Sphingomonas sp. HITSZ_GF]